MQGLEIIGVWDLGWKDGTSWTTGGEEKMQLHE